MFTSAYRDGVAPYTAGLNEQMADTVERAPAAGIQVAGMLGPMGEQLHHGVLQGFMDGTQAALTAVAIYLAIVAVAVFLLLYRYHRGQLDR